MNILCTLISSTEMALACALRPIKRSLFAVLSRTGVALYSRLPIVGALRASLAIIRNGELLLVIDRSDGRGLSLPGAFTLLGRQRTGTVREVFEETGLQVGKSILLFEHRTSLDIPCMITVFEPEATGELNDSW